MATKDRMHIEDGAHSRLGAAGLDNVEAILSYRGGRFAAISSTSETIEVFPPDQAPDEPSLYVKRYRYPKRSHRIRAAFRGAWLGRSRARFEFDRLRTLRRKGVPTIEPMAFGERRVGVFVVASVLITRGAPGQSLLSFARTEIDLQPRDRRAIIEALAERVRRVHRAGVVHGSMVWRDILIDRDETGAFTFVFLDPARVARYYVPGLRCLGFLRDLADLGATAMLLCSRSERLRFIRTYLGRERLRRRDRGWLKRLTWCVRRRVDQERHRMEVNDIFIAPAVTRP